MKRSELNVGDELFYARKWEWGQHEGTKVRVLSTEPYGRDYDHRKVPRKSGTGVLVSPVDVNGKKQWDEIVQLSQLRGQWADVEPVQAKLRAERQAALAKQREAREAREERLRGLQVRLAGAGYPCFIDDYHEHAITFEPDVLERMLDAFGIGSK